MKKGKKPMRRGTVASKPVKMNDHESSITTRVGKERKEDHGTKKTNSKENTIGTLRNEEETDKEVKTKDEIEEETNKEVKTKDVMEGETNKEVKTKDEIEGETNKEVKTKDEIEGESKEKVKKLSKINKRKKIALGVVNVMIPEGTEKPESSHTKKIALGGGDALATEDPTKKKSLNMERKEKIVVINSNELVGKDLEKSKSSNTFSTRKRMALTILDAMTNQDGNEQKSSIKKRKKRKMNVKSPNEVVAKDIGKLKVSKKEKMEKETVGMIFMCNSETKNDCYRYKVLGLPRSKKDIVLRIHKGMMLFLFDFDLKLLYGIYKAAGPGAFDIEPRAFKSAFPAQVSNHALQDF
ncbi:B2 protein [Morella rubra]|uniref:B2 protein n=1 Tax=Morella rubra TaxID=262757 RepID=A0A6A1WLD2_9ROSI|nr:B2 protein [Morella rubra]KAB1225954.1 B2 protein [Morella rubra]